MTATIVSTAVSIGRPSGDRTSLESLAAGRGVKHRDCRDCPRFESQGDDLAYGWCRSHKQYVKLYHPAGAFWSQCQFKALARERKPASAPAA